MTLLQWFEKQLVKRSEKREIDERGIELREDQMLDNLDWQESVRMKPEVLEHYVTQAWQQFVGYKLPSQYLYKTINGVHYALPDYDEARPMWAQLEDVIAAALVEDPHREVGTGGCPYCKVSQEDINSIWHPCPYAPWKSDPIKIYEIYHGGES